MQLLELNLQVAIITLQNILNKRNSEKVNKLVFLGKSCNTREEDCLFQFLLQELREFYSTDLEYSEKLLNKLMTYNSFILEFEKVLETEKNNFENDICEDCCKTIGQGIVNDTEDCEAFIIGPCEELVCENTEFAEEEFACGEFI